MSQKKLLSAAFALSITLSHGALAAGLGFAPGPAGWDYYSSQNLLIGATQTLQASVNYGQGVTVATLDTGITTDWVGFGGLNVSSYQCLNNTCGTAAANSDNNGHGTFVASEIIGGVQFSNGNGMLGVAPFANMVSVKVLDANGSGYSNDVYNGIKYAVDHGAKILNLSLGPTGSAAQQVAFYNSLAGAINYAAAQNAIIVFAGGNSSQFLAGGTNIGSTRPTAVNPNLFSDAALQRMFFMGATNSKLVRTSYSNMPGSAGFYSSTGKFYSYKNMWLMADGGGVSNGQCVDCIVGAPNVVGANYLALEAGTSMAAPQGVGAAALLAARWPVLMSQGSLVSLLETTATDLGSRGVDIFYGDGLINLAKAFQPVGTLSVITKGGSTVSTSGSSVLTGGALGAMSRVTTILSNYTAFDTYNRDFKVDLSGMINTRPSQSVAGQSIGAPKIVGGTTHFANGANLSFGNMTDTMQTIDQPGSRRNQDNWYAAFTDVSGSTVAAGSGFPASASFANALWGNDSESSASVSGMVYSLGVSNALLNLAQGGTFLAFGNELGKDSRVAFSWTQTQPTTSATTDWTKPDATSFSTGFTTKVADGWKAGITFGLLDEKGGILGTTYDNNGPLSFGSEHQSMSMGLSSAFNLGDKFNLLIDAAIVRSSGAHYADGIISDISPLYARSAGAALVKGDTVRKGDSLSLSMRSPLRVFSGSANVTTASVDVNGDPVLSSQRVNLAPNGNELDFSVGYGAPVSDNMSWNISVNARRNVDNIQGYNDADVLIGTKLTF